ncbi:hypothetical protein PCI56_13120 [Plesiomonas shigelloides subsp. oncorhynchi]|nr:hypothetical protein [Plesiomonas shigelloides]
MLEMVRSGYHLHGKRFCYHCPDSSNAMLGGVDVLKGPEMTELFSCDDVFAVCGGPTGMKTWLINTRQNGCHLPSV